MNVRTPKPPLCVCVCVCVRYRRLPRWGCSTGWPRCRCSPAWPPARRASGCSPARWAPPARSYSPSPSAGHTAAWCSPGSPGTWVHNTHTQMVSDGSFMLNIKITTLSLQKLLVNHVLKFSSSVTVTHNRDLPTNRISWKVTHWYFYWCQHATK